jgi:transposase
MTTMLERSEEMVDKQVRGKYNLEYKLESVRQVKAGQSGAVVAKVLGIPSSSVANWARLDAKGQLGGATEGKKAQTVTAEQMEIARLRAENARLKMERDIAKKAAAYFAQDVLQSTLGSGK